MKKLFFVLAIVLYAPLAFAQGTYTQGIDQPKKTAPTPAPAQTTQPPVYQDRIPPAPNPDDANPYWQCRAQAVTSQDIINCNNWDRLAHNPPRPYGYYPAYGYGGYGYYYNPLTIPRAFRKFGVEEEYGAFKIEGDLPRNQARNVKVCVDGVFRDEATNLKDWSDPSSGLTTGKHIIELRDLSRMRAFKEQVEVEPKAVTETFGANRFKINLYRERLEGQDSYAITGSCPGR